jgi:hypothetical protein
MLPSMHREINVSFACGVALLLLAMGLQPAFGPRRIAVLPRRR